MMLFHLLLVFLNLTGQGAVVASFAVRLPSSRTTTSNSHSAYYSNRYHYASKEAALRLFHYLHSHSHLDPNGGSSSGSGGANSSWERNVMTTDESIPSLSTSDGTTIRTSSVRTNGSTTSVSPSTATKQQLLRNTKKRRRKKKKRSPPFPKKAYYLARDEDNLKHTFMSFIDIPIWSSYSQVARLVEPRLYARADQFEQRYMDVPPTIDDVAPPPSLYGKVATALAWNGLAARAIVGTVSYLSFPYIVEFLSSVTRSVDQEDLETLVNSFLPGASIVLGCYFSLTLSILYDRFAELQKVVNLESSLLAVTCQNIVDLFRNNPGAAVRGAQCIADQIGTMVRDSRGRETMMVIYNDPYQRLLKLLKDYEQDYEEDDENGYEMDEQLLGQVRAGASELFALRAQRMSYEGLGLRPTHFNVMTFLSGILLTGYALGTLPSSHPVSGEPAGIAQFFFAMLVVVYVLFYEMCFDLNRPFDGVYQLRRSGAAMHFLQVKQLVSSDPMLRGNVDFEPVPYDSSDDEECLGCEGFDEISCAKRKAEIWYN